MSTPEKTQRLSNLHLKSRSNAKAVKRLEKKLDEAIERKGIEVDDALHQDLQATISAYSVQVKDQYPPGSFQRIFWEQQEKASKLRSAKSMKWEPAMIRLLLDSVHVMSSLKIIVIWENLTKHPIISLR